MVTDSTALQRRLVRLKARRTTAGKPDAYLEGLLDDALETFLQITHRTADPGEGIDGLMVDMATHWSNMEGAEFTEGATEGDMSRTWTNLPDAIYKRMISYRKVAGLIAESDDA